MPKTYTILCYIFRFSAILDLKINISKKNRNPVENKLVLCQAPRLFILQILSTGQWKPSIVNSNHPRSMKTILPEKAAFLTL